MSVIAQKNKNPPSLHSSHVMIQTGSHQTINTPRGGDLAKDPNHHTVEQTLPSNNPSPKMSIQSRGSASSPSTDTPTSSTTPRRVSSGGPTVSFTRHDSTGAVVGGGYRSHTYSSSSGTRNSSSRSIRNIGDVDGDDDGANDDLDNESNVCKLNFGRLSTHLYGRSNEVQLLQDAFYQTCTRITTTQKKEQVQEVVIRTPARKSFKEGMSSISLGILQEEDVDDDEDDDDDQKKKDNDTNKQGDAKGNQEQDKKISNNPDDTTSKVPPPSSRIQPMSIRTAAAVATAAAQAAEALEDESTEMITTTTATTAYSNKCLISGYSGTGKR